MNPPSSAFKAARHTPLLFALLAFSVIALGTPAQTRAEITADTPRIRIGWVDAPPIVDGKMDDAVWAEGALVDQLTQVLPDTGAPATQRTEIRVLTDGKTLFIGFRCFDTNPELIVRNRMARDNFPFFDDRVGIVLDTFHTERNGYFFGTNPNAMRHDVLFEAEEFEVSWDTIWFVETSIDAEGWTAEMAIPFSSLSFDPNQDTWGINFERGVRRNDEDTRWTDAVPQRFLSNLGSAGILEGMRGIDQGLGFELTPGLTIRGIEDSDLGSLNNDDRVEVDPTFDGFYKILPSVTAAVTANTDFGQTEVDAVQVNLDRFALFFPEKRDFFLEDGLIFDFGDISQNGRPFFSRRIGLVDGAPVDILGGGKVTGRLGPVKFGVLDTYVDRKGGTDARNLFTARAAANVLGESTLGAIVTNGNPSGGQGSTTFGLDFLYRNSNFRGTNESVRASLWWAQSRNQDRPSSRRNNGYGIKLEYPQDRINWLLGFEELQEDYDPKLGFVNRNDIRHGFASFRFRSRPDEGPFRTLTSSVFGQVFVDSGNEVESINLQIVPLEVVTPVGDGADIRYRFRFERVRSEFSVFDVPEDQYNFHEGALRIFTSRNRPLRAFLEIAHGSFFDGTRFRFDSDIEWRPSPFFQMSFQYQFRDINLPQGGSTLAPRPGELAAPDRNDRDTQLIRLRATAQFTPDISWSTFVQYDNVSDSAGINSRFRWIIRDGREFFIVYNQALDTEENEVRRGRTEGLVKAVWTLTY